MQDSESGEVVDHRRETVKDAVLVTCIWCRRLHPPEHPLEFHPVCPVCAGCYPLGSVPGSGSHALTDEQIDELVTRSSPGNYALGYAASDEAAFEEECRSYHGLGGSDGLDNECHPAPPPGSARKCPVHPASASPH